MSEGGPKRTMLSVLPQQSSADPTRLVPVQTTSAAGRTVMTAVSLDKISCRGEQQVPSASISSSAVLSHRPLASTTPALPPSRRLEVLLCDDERWGRANIEEMADYAHALILSNEKLEAERLRLQRHQSASSEKQREQQPVVKMARVEERPALQQHQGLHFSFQPRRDGFSSVAASLGSSAWNTDSMWLRPPPPPAADRSTTRSFLMELLSRSTPVVSESELTSIVDLSSPLEKELAFAVLERSLSMLLSHVAGGTTGSTSPKLVVAFTPPPLTAAPTADRLQTLGLVSSTSQKLFRKFAGCSSAVGLLDAWLRCCAFLEPAPADMHTTICYIVQLVRAADVGVMNWLRYFFLSMPPAVAQSWANLLVYPTLLSAVCTACAQCPRRIEVINAALPLTVVLLSTASVQQAIAPGAGPLGLAEAVMQLAGIVEVLLPQLEHPTLTAAASEVFSMLLAARLP